MGKVAVREMRKKKSRRIWGRIRPLFSTGQHPGGEDRGKARGDPREQIQVGSSEGEGAGVAVPWCFVTCPRRAGGKDRDAEGRRFHKTPVREGPGCSRTFLSLPTVPRDRELAKTRFYCREVQGIPAEKRKSHRSGAGLHNGLESSF